MSVEDKVNKSLDWIIRIGIFLLAVMAVGAVWNVIVAVLK